MSIFSNIQAKTQAIAAALPAIGDLVKAAEVLAPHAGGLKKAELVVTTLTTVEPALASYADALYHAVSGVVDLFRATGQMPTAPAQATTAQATTAQAIDPPVNTSANISAIDPVQNPTTGA